MLNKFLVAGRLTADPEIQTKGDKVAADSFANSSDGNFGTHLLIIAGIGGAGYYFMKKRK